jgi:hypothetical protein
MRENKIISELSLWDGMLNSEERRARDTLGRRAASSRSRSRAEKLLGAIRVARAAMRRMQAQTGDADLCDHVFMACILFGSNLGAGGLATKHAPLKPRDRARMRRDRVRARVAECSNGKKTQVVAQLARELGCAEGTIWRDLRD